MLEKVAVICPNIGIVYSGMGPDFRVLVNKARKSAQAYWKIYGEYPPTLVLTQEVATLMQQATQSGCVYYTIPNPLLLNGAILTAQRSPSIRRFAPCGRLGRNAGTHALSG
jgi:20S proteasome subunit alpha 2